MLQVIEDLLDHHRVFDAGDDFHGTAAGAAGLDVDIEYTLEPLCPCHRRSPLCWCCRFIGYSDLVAPAPLCRRDQRPVLAVGVEYTVKRVRLMRGFGSHHGISEFSQMTLVCRYRAIGTDQVRQAAGNYSN